ncbi:MAG: TolC family protein [Gemmatimonadales bacterium]
MRSSRFPALAAALAVTAWAALPASAQVEGGDTPRSPADEQAKLDLAEVLALTEAGNPMLLGVRSAAAAAAAREPEASTLPDPSLRIGIMDFGLPSFATDMQTSMVPSIQLMQMVPFPGKLGLMGEVAAYTRRIAESEADETWWTVRQEVASLFYDLYATDRSLEVMRETLGLLRDFREVADAMYVSGMGRQADVLRADVEVARMDAEIRRMEAMRASDAAMLNALLDRPANTNVPSPVLGELPMEVPARDTLLAWARESRPRVAASRLAVERARTELSLARREIWPDLTIGLGYGQRNVGMGTERMGSAMVEFSLPVHAGRRQYAMRAEAEAMEGMARSDLAAAEASVDARIGALLADLERARALATLYRDEVIPQAHATVESALSSYRVGRVDFMTLVDAQMTLNQYEGELYRLRADHGKAVASLESETGRELPRTGPMLRDDP